jgi:hypothetical protein
MVHATRILVDNISGTGPFMSVQLEQVFSLNVYVYDLKETEADDIAARLVRRSPYKYDDTMNLNLIHQLKQRQLCFSKYGLEERLWHQSGGQTAC